MDRRDQDKAPAAPDIRLALAYVPAVARPALAALFALDERLASIRLRARDPALGMLRLAWWRDALDALSDTPPPDEPLLRRIAATLAPATRGGELAAIAEGWMALLEGPPDAEALEAHAAGRGGQLFSLAARLLGVEELPDAARAGEVWALVDIAPQVDGMHSARVIAEARRRVGAGPGVRWPVPARPLGMLASIAVADARGVRMSPAMRLLRMLAHRVTGRTGLGVTPERD